MDRMCALRVLAFSAMPVCECCGKEGAAKRCSRCLESRYNCMKKLHPL